MADVRVRKVTPEIGAEIRGIDLQKPMTAETRTLLQKALGDHLALFFPEQTIDEAQFVAFAECFGAPIVAKRTTSKSRPEWASLTDHFPEIVVLDEDQPRGKGSDLWHADSTYQPDPPLAITLRSVRLPVEGGDTCFASMYAAYAALSPAMQAFLDGLTAVHDVRKSLEHAARAGSSPESLEEVLAKYPPTEHPVVRIHPLSGRKALFVNRHHTTRIVGLSDRENETLLPFLFDQVGNPEFQYRYTWSEQSITVWDNWSTQHLGVPDYGTRRIMQRIGIAYAAETYDRRGGLGR
jgi:taurine dioxygenase